ncbi:nitrogen fixation negative regulator NifL [Beggiatoa alba B18LD]|uniref:histidine kinase n=1 Tax=Beggiatoa alba B18LD TaxID=395493 RepID=I3CCA7_9GAMM|nr:nitrogen fixation negative regulator NifL [Beggiatoa alba]EIJ41250.1 nitrogen fixation negative regulator NifL [Beggiatoa alba B18LD]
MSEPQEKMTKQLLSARLNTLTDAIESFLNNPPEGTPTDILELFKHAVTNEDTALPPRLFFEAVEQAQVAISITDLDAKILYANPAFEQVTGYALENIIGKKESALSDHKTPSLVYKTLWGRLKQNKPWTGMLVNRRENGERYLAEVIIAPVLNKQGDAAYYLGMHRDMTDVYHLEQKVKSQKALIESVVDSAPVVIALLNDHEKVVLDNHEYKKLVGDLRGLEPAKLFLTALKDALGNEWKDLSSNDGSFEDQEVSLDMGGNRQPRWFVCAGTWFRERDSSADAFFEVRKESYFLLVAKEITELKHRQEEVRMNALRALLAEGEVIENMRETLTGAIHQFQGPINMIAAAVGMLERRSEAKGSSDPLCDALKNALSAAEQAIDNLRQSTPSLTNEAIVPVNLNELLRDVLTLSTSRLLANGIVVDWIPTPILPPMLGRVGRLRSLFKHLIDNALDAMQDNRGKLSELRVRTAATEEGMLRIIVEDTGPGIPEHLRLKVFEPFFTTKGRAHRSAGLGLTAVQEVVNLHAGTIRIDPDYDSGCRFIVQFPSVRYREAV